MAEPVIKVENLAKRYRINTLRNRDTLLGEIKSLVTGLPGFRSVNEDSEEDFVWALNDISFEVQPGEVLGIVGKNGSGKSTLLKLLSRIIRPTRGRMAIRGTVASLLEVGTGFHPELSGRENVFLNAAILGMTRAETRRKFDEIVEFAEVGRFIDTPVKRYSSGMRTRLAFAVAAHLEPDILLVDEVLAVGDTAFQKKSIGKMNEVGQEGRTVLFVSHNMSAVASLCTRAILLSNGQIIASGQTTDVIRRYAEENTATSGAIVWENPEQAPGNDAIRLHSIRVISEGKEAAEVDISKDITIAIEYDNLREGGSTIASLALTDRVGTFVLGTGNFTAANIGEDPWYRRPQPVGRYRAYCHIPGSFLNEGLYNVQVFMLSGDARAQAVFKDGLSFSIYDTGEMREDFYHMWQGVVRPRLKWRSEQVTEDMNEIETISEG